MDPVEQRLRDEVIYLHSLWHQGPPPPPSRHHHFTPPQTHVLPFLLPGQPQFQHYPIQVPIFINPTPTNPSFRQPLLRVSNPTPFKRNSRNRWLKKKKKARNFNAERDGTPTDSGKEWPYNEYPSPDSHNWPEPKKGSPMQPISEEDQAKLANLRMQHRVIDELRGVFVKEEDDDGGGGDDEEEEGNDDGGGGGCGGGGLEESEEYKVLLDVFVKDSALREYYEKNCGNGEFFCFVCGVFGIKKYKSGKKYKSCLGLLQHTISITKTTNRRAHRAFGMVICKVIGWNFNRVPTVIVKGEPLGRSLENTNVESIEGGRDMGIDNNNKATNGMELDNNVRLQTLPEEDGTCCNFDNPTEQRADENVNEVKTPECMNAEISPVRGIEWPCQNINDACSSEGWPTSKSLENSSARVTSAEENENFEAYKLQKRVLETCQDFFQSKSGVEDGDNEGVNMGGSDDDDGEGSEDDTVEGTDSEECEEFKFFTRIFLENADLKSYYENNDEDGYFCCLVCGGVGKKTWKRFKGYTGLLQHSLTISKTRKRAHRALGRAMCKVFGWDINQFTKYTTNVTLLHECSGKSIDAEG